MKKLLWPNAITLHKYSVDANQNLGLERVKSFFNYLGNPEKKLPPIFHVAGTNGKGSTTAFLKYIFEEEGYLVHRFTSPHLVELNERIEVSSKIISDEYLKELYLECRKIDDEKGFGITYFEGLFIIAVLAFAENPAIATILEVGLGGRLDATNTLESSLASIITSISFDHMNYFGNTLPLIAKEKAGIIKQNGTLIIDKQPEGIDDLLYEEGLKKNNKVYSYGKEWNIEKLKYTFIFKGFGKELEIPLPSLQGDHQLYNAGGAIAAILSQNKIKVSEKSIVNGIKNTKWNARLQDITKETKLNGLINDNSEVILDGAHNEDAAKQLSNWLKSKNDDKYNILIIGMLSRKDSQAYIKNITKKFNLIITTRITNEKTSRDENELKNEFLENGFYNVLSKINFIKALLYIKENIKQNKIRIVIAGSLYLAGEILEYINS